MVIAELAGMVTSELEERLTDARQELFNLRFQLATGQLDNTARIGEVRREVARVLTVLRQRELTGEGEVASAATAADDASAEAGTSRSRRRLGRRRAVGEEAADEAATEPEASGAPEAGGGTGEVTEDVATDTEEEG